MKTKAFAYEEVTVDSGTVVSTLTAATFSGGNEAFITVEGGSMRYRIDGGDPSTIVGHLLSAGDNLRLRDIGEMNNFKAVKSGDLAGTLRVTYSKGV